MLKIDISSRGKTLLSDEEKIEKLFFAGLELFNQGEYFDAHEQWEEMWSEYNLPDRFFVQGLIQATVSFYHLSTGNLKGARNLMTRAIDKLTKKGPDRGHWITPQRSTDASNFIEEVKKCYAELFRINKPDEFDLELIPNLKKVEKL